MNIVVNSHAPIARLAISGRFDFDSHRDFRSACDEALQTPGVEEIELDLSQVEYLDSSALGMLLLLRDKAQTAKIKLALTKCSAFARKIFEVARFDRLFTIR